MLKQLYFMLTCSTFFMTLHFQTAQSLIIFVKFYLYLFNLNKLVQDGKLCTFYFIDNNKSSRLSDKENDLFKIFNIFNKTMFHFFIIYKT